MFHSSSMFTYLNEKVNHYPIVQSYKAQCQFYFTKCTSWNFQISWTCARAFLAFISIKIKLIKNNNNHNFFSLAFNLYLMHAKHDVIHYVYCNIFHDIIQFQILLFIKKCNKSLLIFSWSRKHKWNRRIT